MQSLGGVVWRIVRLGLVAPPVGYHGSETALDRAPAFDATLTNDGSVEDLGRRIQALLGPP